ncbi:hypothetical protein SAMN05216251_102477 [Actinacidiphila alni]|uniref:Uncharacterized protein n=1 Tax=Actinacidiphila alni TaxID=380248 RepID=A0A1I1ZN45_9ACTN|nr:hypothetical protein [Actinacidiphila alni]SFE31780.1 hypothetical protein SAMN05216251_102477 [Actinacidiphila alni]
MSTPTGPQDPRIPHQNGAVPQADRQQTQPAQQQPAQAPRPQPQPYGQQPPPAQPQAPQPQAPQQQAQPGYGFPPTQYPQPVQQGYPYEIRPGVPQVPQPQPYVPNPNEPDWSALADQNVAERKRKRLMIIGGASVVVIALAVGAALLFAGGSDKKDDGKQIADKQTSAPAVSPTGSASGSPTGTPSGSPTGTPTGSPTPTLQGSDLFTAKTLTVDGQSFARKATSHRTPCWKSTQGGLGPILDKNKCTQIVLATYVSGKDSVSVGVLVFPTAAQAGEVNAGFKGKLIPLTGQPGIPNFCKQVPCAVTHAVHGRYVYTTLAGPNDGKAGNKDAHSVAAGHGIAGYTLSRLLDLD